MKKIIVVSIISFVFLAICSVVEYYLRAYEFQKVYTPLIIGLLIMVFSGLLASAFRRDTIFNAVSFLINAIALGFCLRSWYLYKGYDNEIWITLLVSLSCVAYLLLFYFLLYIPFLDKHFDIFIWVFLGLTLIIYLIAVFSFKTTFISTFGYFVIIEISFIFSMCKTSESFKELFRNITLCSFSVLIVAILMILIMTECDGIDGFDFGGGSSSELTSPKNKKTNFFE